MALNSRNFSSDNSRGPKSEIKVPPESIEGNTIPVECPLSSAELLELRDLLFFKLSSLIMTPQGCKDTVTSRAHPVR